MGGMPGPSPDLTDRIAALLESDFDRPWCVHRLHERLSDRPDSSVRSTALKETERAADRLAESGRAGREVVSAISIGIHCEDTLYWSTRAERQKLADFGPEFESPTILRRLGSHFVCRGL